jgi:hypothetical protein
MSHASRTRTFALVLLLHVFSVSASSYECNPNAGCNVCEHCCNEFIVAAQCGPCASKCDVFVNDRPQKLVASSSPHAAWRISFNLDRYDDGAKILFAFFVVRVATAAVVVNSACLLGRGAFRKIRRRWFILLVLGCCSQCASPLCALCSCRSRLRHRHHWTLRPRANHAS